MHQIMLECALVHAGAKQREDLFAAFEKIYPVLQEFRKGAMQNQQAVVATMAVQVSEPARCHSHDRVRMPLSSSGQMRRSTLWRKVTVLLHCRLHQQRQLCQAWAHLQPNCEVTAAGSLVECV